MKLKQFIFALVAMLSFSFSSFAQTTVTSAADLKAALESTTGGEVVLGGDITLPAQINVPRKTEHILDLNGHNITGGIYVYGTLTINDSKGTGSITASTYVLNGAGGSKIILNGGRIYRGSSWSVYTTGIFVVNGGKVENTIRVAGSGSIQLNGGTVTAVQVTSGNLNITGKAVVDGNLSIEKGAKGVNISAGTINGDVAIATEAKGNVTVSGGTFKDGEAVSEYMEEGKAVVKNEDGSFSVVDGLLKITRTGKCYPSLGDAFNAAVAGDVIILLDDVRVGDKYPTNHSDGITLDINGYTLSSYNNIHRVFDNDGDITITNSKETGKIVGYSIRNKGQMRVQGVRLEFEDGIDCRGGDLYVDGCTIIGKKFAMQNDGGNTTVSNTTLSAETYAIEHRVYGANNTFTIGEGVVIESGKVHTYDIDPGQNIVFPEGYFAATIQKYQTSKFTRAYYYCALPAAVEAVKDGGTVQVLSDVELTDILTLDKAVTLDGNGKTLKSTAGRAINVDCADVVTIENLTIAGATGCERGINIIDKAGTTNLKNVNVSGVSHYAVHVATSAGAAKVNIENSNLTGWAAVAAYGDGGTIKVENSNLVGINNYTGTSNNFATIAAASNIAVNVTGGKVTAESFEGKGNQYIVCGDRTGNVTKGASFTLDTELELKGTAEYANIDLDNNTVTVREKYGTNYVTTPAGNGLVNLTGASEAEVNGVKYAKLEAAFAAATEGQTITLIADVTPSLTSQRAITKAAVIDLNGKTMTLNNADLYFGTTTFKNGTIVVAPSVFANTAVFWMFENQALAFDNVDIVATGVTGTYLIGINGGTGTTVDIINGSSITIDNESKANLTAVICDNGTGNTVTIKGSDIDVKNIEGRLYLGGAKGKITVENSDIDLNGVKEGFYLRAGQSLDIAGTSTVDVVLNSTEGRYGINLTDATAKYTKAETATVNATVFEKKGGNDFNGYTGADRIWGEVWGNAKESFVIKVLDANGNVMGTTSLNNIGGIIDGDVNVTWSILFDAPTPDPAAYWSMEWTTAPSISNMPARVALWVDGVEVSGGSVVLNGPDDLDKIVAAVTDADGKIISCHTSVANAAATNATNIALLRDTNEEISLPVGTILNKNGFNADKVTVKQPVVSINGKQFATFAEALDAVENGQTITLIEGVTGDEKSTEIEFTKDINFTITGKAPQYALPVVTFQNAEVTIKDAEILIPELDARQNAVINVVNSTVHDAGGNSIAKSYYNGTINIDKTSTVYMMQITTMGYINVAGTVNATWQTNVYGNGMISLAQGATFNTAALHLTGKDYSGRDNTDADRVGKPATIVVDGATLNVGKVKSDNGSDYSYNSSKGINVGTVDGKLALLDVKNGGAVNFYMANGQTTNFGAGATVNVAASTLKTISRDENGTVTLANNGTVVVTGNSQLDVKNYSGNAIQLNNGNLVDTYFAGRVDAFGINNISGTTTIGGILGLGYETNPTEQVVVNITGNFNGNNVLVRTNNGVDNILNVGKADGERTKAHFAQLGAFADVNVVNADVTYGYAFIRNDFNATNSTFEIKSGVNTYFAGNAKVVLDNTTWNLKGYANIGSYGGYMYGSADVTLKNGSSMTATSLGVEVSGENVVKLTLEDNSSLTATKLTNQGSIVLASTEATLTSNECANVTTSVPNQVVSYIDGKYTLVAAVAKIGDALYTSLQGAVNAVKNGETITLIAGNEENVTVVQAPDMAFTIDGNGKTMKGTITVDGKSAAYATAGLTIKNVNFVADGIAAEACINLGAKGDSNTRYTSNVTVDNCTFTGTDKAKAGIKNYTGGCKNVTITNSTANGMHSLAQFKTSYGVTLTKNTVTECKNGISVDGSTDVTITECVVDVNGYGIRANGGSDVTVTSNNVKAFTPVVVRSVTANSSFTFNGENTFTAENTAGKWMVIGDKEYEAGVALPDESTANVVVALNDANLSYTGIHGAGLAGKGTEAEPYLINNATELQMFRDKVNGGATKFNAPGVWVALNADINLDGINWVGIGSMTADHGFMGNFDGKGFKIQNLTINNPALDSDGYAYAGLFALTEGTDKDNQNTIKNLTIENVTINTTGHIVSAAIAYAYYTNVDNVKVCGNIAITGGDYTAGVLAYTRRCVNASNLAVEGNEGSFVKGTKIVGGVISDIQMNGGLTAVYSNFSAEGITVTGEKSVGGIAGIIATQTLNGATVKNVTLNSADEFAGVVAGRLGGTSTISNVVSENVTGATAVIGATYDDAKAVEARIGDTYYSTFAAAYTAAKADETVTMLTDLNMSEILVLDKAITLDGNGKTLTSTAGRAINVDCEGNVAIKNLTINASGERAINVIQKPAKVTIDNVTATAANYTVNLAGSAAGAVVVVKNSNLTGLNVVNVAAADAQVTVDKTTLNCADNSEAEGYAALVLNKDAKNGSIVATDVTFNINGDSKKASNQAEGGTITIDGSADEVEQHVAYISYGNNWYGFATLEAAIAKAEAGETVTLLRDVKASAIITIDKAITLDGNGKTLTSTAGRAINVDCEGNVGIKNLTINASGERAINVIQKPANVTIENVTATAANYTVNVASSAGAAKVAISKSTLNGLCTVNVAAAGAQVTVDNSTVNCNDNNTTAGESYAALCLNKAAVGASIIATNTTVNVTEGSDSEKGRNGAEGGVVTINGSTEGVTVTVAVITYPGSDNYHGFASLADAVEFAKAGDVITLIRDVTISYGARDLLATAAADKAVTIDGNGKTLTLNQTNSDWSSIGLENNNKLVLKNMTINKDGKGATSGAWNTHAIIFSTAVEMENVTVNNSVVVAADAAFTNVVFNEANGYYSLWIEANGQTVTVKGGSMTATNGGRGIKIADQYINAPAKVTLSVDGTVFNTAKKAAVLVSSKAGAEITAANVNIENVAEDKVNFAWVDGGWATYFGNVTVNGAPAVMEDAASFVAAVTVNGAVKAYYATIAKAIEAVEDGEAVELVADVTANEVILLGKSLTINGNGHKVTSNATRVFRVTTSDTEVTLNNVNMVSNAVRVGTNDIRGISIDAGLQNVELTLNNCSVDFTDPSANDWTYAVNVSGNGTGHTVTVNGGSYEGANVINAHGANNTITVKGATLTSTYPASDLYYGACFWVLQNQGSSVVAEGNTFEANNSIVFNVGTGTAVTESKNVDNTKVYVAKVGTVYYHSVNEAINAAADGATVQLLGDRRIDEAIAPWTGDSQHKLEKSITIQGYADFGTTLTGGMFLGYNDGTVRENTITVKGINFVGKGVVVANQKNVVIEGNKFTGINALVSDKHANSNCAVLVIGTSKDMSIAATVKNNVIENVANAGIYLSQVAAVVVEGNTVTGTKHNALTVSAATTATVDVKNNTFAQWGLGGEGRAMRISGAATVNVNENVMSYEGAMPEEFVKVTGATAFNASANYWNGESLLTEGLLAGVDPLTVASSYYTDAEKQNLVELTATKSVAKVGKTYYVTFAEAFNVAAQTGKEVTILAGEYTGGLTIDKAITVKGETDADGKNLVAFTGTLSIKANGATVKNLNFTNTSGKAASINAKDVLIEGCSLVGSNGLYQSYTSGLVTFKDSYIKGGIYGIHFDGKAGGEIVIDNCTVIGWTSFAKSIKKVTITGTEFAEGNYNYVRFYQEDITIEDCTFNEKMMVDLSVDGATATVNNCTVEGDRTAESLFEGADIVNSDITVNGVLLVRVAKIGNVYYETLAEAVVAAETGAVVTMVDDVETSAAGYATIGEEGYAVIVAVKEKEITLDLNGKSITVNPTAEELANAEGNMLMSVFGMDTNGKLTLTGNGSVKVNANGANVYSLVAAYGEGSAVVIENGSYEADAVNASGSLIYSHEMITVKGGTFNLGNLASGANGSPWIFNTIGQNYTGVTVEGGTYPTDINHQFWANEVLVPEAYALKNNGDGTWTVVDAVAYTNEKATSRGAKWRHVGYASLEDAIAATGKYNCENNTVTMSKDIAVEKTITVANGVKVAIDLNGVTISGTDNNTSGNFYLIDNRGTLTITDSSEEAAGKITLKANNDRGTSSSSVVVANNPGGKLAVWDGTIEHLGGTYMAYGIDNLTNGNLGDVNCTIDGGTIKSTYRAVRQFLNSDSKENNLVINGGTIEGVNKSIFFHDPSAKANNGTLYVAADAALTGDVYLFVTEGSTEWPVEVEVAVAALKGESTVTSKNVPDTYYVTEYPTAWIVECSELAELTINEVDYAETGYINLVKKNVKELTYVREFENTGWQSLYLPFGFTITEEMAAEFEFAYIYNASYKNKETLIDFVPVGVGFELAANYPYMIRAKEAGEKVIVVKDAVLEVTKNETIDCSSVFEKFTFAGNYAANFAPEAPAQKKFFALDGGWSKLTTLNPFRFYLQIEMRNGSEFPADSDAANSIRMRSVDQNGNATTGVDSVDADQNAGLIFDLHGRRVAEPEKGGIYIINGQKVLVK